MDNRIFNVNGTGFEFLKLTIQLALAQSNYKIQAYEKDKRGLTFHSIDYYSAGHLPLPTPTDNHELISAMAWDWLNSESSKEMDLTDDDDRYDDYDVSNELGWRVYSDDIENFTITPSYLYYGK